MTIVKTILAAASGGSASAGTIELACGLARRFDARLEGFHAKADPYDLLKYDTAIGASFTDTFVEKFIADADRLAKTVEADFVATAKRHGMQVGPRPANALPRPIGASAVWNVETGYGPALVARRARFFDLAVLGRSGRVIEEPYSDAAEEALLRSGRPVLLAPAVAPTSIGDRIVIGWNGSAESVRAMTAALPFLAAARETIIVSVGDQHLESGRSAIDYLAWHDIKARHEAVVTAAGLGVGQQLLRTAAELGANLVAIGAYGHMPWRELLFGGATREVISASLMPVLLTH